MSIEKQSLFPAISLVRLFSTVLDKIQQQSRLAVVAEVLS